MLIGGHVGPDDPLATAVAEGADCVQIFLGDPQGWKKPPPREDAAELKAADTTIYVHAPYIVNVASPNNRIRIPSRKILQQTVDAAEEIGAAGVIVHGGHVTKDDTEAKVRETFREKAWNNPVVRLLDQDGKDLVPRLADEWSLAQLADGMVQSRRLAKLDVPTWLAALRDDAVARRRGLERAVFAMA